MTICDGNDMRKLARAEEFLRDGEDVMFVGRYVPTAADMAAALKRVADGELTPKEIYKSYACPVFIDHAEYFGIDEIKARAEEQPGYAGLPVTDEQVVAEVIGFFERLDEVIRTDTDERVQQELLSACIGMYRRAARGAANSGKAIEDMEFDVEEKECYIQTFADSKEQEKASEAELRLCRKFIEELCGQKNYKALEVKAYSAYEGDRLYPQDWFVAKDCLEEMLDISGEPHPANSLGYIYYYGRCNEGVPEYEKAFQMFSLAAACGLYQAMYKLGDLYLHGNGCRKSVRAAFSLYQMVYDDCVGPEGFDEDGQFADAALRMGNCALNGWGTSLDPKMAYAYFLQAEYAIKQRRKYDQIGDSSVCARIGDGLNKAKEQLPEDFLKEKADYRDDTLFSLFTDAGRSVIGIEKTGDNTLRITLTSPRPLFLTFPEISFCGKVKKLMLTAEDVIDCHMPEDTTAFDHTEYEAAGDAVVFYDKGEEVGWIRCGGYSIRADEEITERE